MRGAPDGWARTSQSRPARIVHPRWRDLVAGLVVVAEELAVELGQPAGVGAVEDDLLQRGEPGNAHHCAVLVRAARPSRYRMVARCTTDATAHSEWPARFSKRTTVVQTTIVPSAATMFSARRSRDSATRLTVPASAAVPSILQPSTWSAASRGCSRRPRKKRQPNRMHDRSSGGAPSNNARAHCSAVRGWATVPSSGSANADSVARGLRHRERPRDLDVPHAGLHRGRSY